MISIVASTKKTKVIDKWKTKQWYTVLAPQIFENKEIAEIISSDEENLKNRIISLSLGELIGPSSQSAIFTLLKFRINEVKGKNAHTKLIGHEISSSYIRTLSRRGRSILNVVCDVKTKDDQVLRMKILAVSGTAVSQNTKKNIYRTIMDELKKISAKYKLDQLIQEVIFGKFASLLFNRIKQITPMKRVEIKKTELVEVLA